MGERRQWSDEKAVAVDIIRTGTRSAGRRRGLDQAFRDKRPPQRDDQTTQEQIRNAMNNPGSRVAHQGKKKWPKRKLVGVEGLGNGSGGEGRGRRSKRNGYGNLLCTFNTTEGGLYHCVQMWLMWGISRWQGGRPQTHRRARTLACQPSTHPPQSLLVVSTLLGTYCVGRRPTKSSFFDRALEPELENLARLAQNAQNA